METRTAFQRYTLYASLVPLFLAGRFFDQWLTDQTFLAMNAPKGGTGMLFLLAALGLVTSVVLPIIAAVVLFQAWGYGPGTLTGRINQLVKEELRVFGSTLLWAFLLILPGLYKLVQYGLVPLIVLLDPEYDKGHKDALEESKRLFRKVWGRLLLTVTGFFIVFPLALTAFDEYRSFEDHAIAATALTLTDLGLFVLLQFCLLKIWQRASQIRTENRGPALP